MMLDGLEHSFEQQWRDYRATTERTLSRLESLTEDLLLLADGTYDRTQSEHNVVELANILADATSFMEPVAVKYGVTLHLMEPCTALVKGEESFLFLIFRNLLDNAIRYNRPNGNVTLQVLHEDGRVVVRVSDMAIPQSMRNVSVLKLTLIDRSIILCS